MVEPSGLITAKHCKTGFVVYGPYAAVAANSDVELSFELEAQTTFNLYTEVVSAMGTKLYGALPDQPVEKGTTRKFALKLHPYVPIEGLETRLVVTSPTPVDFKIRDFNLRVH